MNRRNQSKLFIYGMLAGSVPSLVLAGSFMLPATHPLATSPGYVVADLHISPGDLPAGLEPINNQISNNLHFYLSEDQPVFRVVTKNLFLSNRTSEGLEYLTHRP